MAVDPALARRRPDRALAERGGTLELLRLPAALFGMVARARAALYERGWLPELAVETPVVSVGNLTAGGTGKTPMVAWLAGELRRRGLEPGLLSRGYGRSRAERERGAPGDEARMLARILPDVPCVENPDRVAGAQRLEDLGVDVILVDDGFQHRRLHRDLDLVLVDATRPWGLAPPRAGGEAVCALLPRGLLRERPSALARADAIVLTRSDCVAADALTRLRRNLGECAPGVPLVEAVHRPRELRRPGGGPAAGPSWLAGRRIDLVSAIGNPEGFEATVRDLGGRIREHRVFPDHHAFRPADLAGLGGCPVVTTGKDAVKLPAAEVDIWVLEIELAFPRGADAIGSLLDGLPESPAARVRRGLHAGLHG